MTQYPNAGLTRGYAKDLRALRLPCDVDGCTRSATHSMDPKAFGVFVPFRAGQRNVAGPAVCEIDAIMIESDLRLGGSRFDDKAPNSDPKAPRWEQTITMKAAR